MSKHVFTIDHCIDRIGDSLAKWGCPYYHIARDDAKEVLRIRVYAFKEENDIDHSMAYDTLRYRLVAYLARLKKDVGKLYDV